jgi:phage-related protein
MGLIFDGVDIEAEYGIVVDGADTWAKPERDREAVHVPGRSGDLIHDNGSWHNVEIEYHCLIEHGFADRFDAFCDWLHSHLGYFRFEDQLRHPGVYRMAEFYGPLEPETIFRDHAGKFDLKFNCKPQQWLTSGEEAVDLTYMAWVSGYYPAGDRLPYSDTEHDIQEYYYKISPAGFITGEAETSVIATPIVDIRDISLYTVVGMRVRNVSDHTVTVEMANVAYDANMQMLTNYDTATAYYSYQSYVKQVTLEPGQEIAASSQYDQNEAYRRWSVLTNTSLDDLEIYYYVGGTGSPEQSQKYLKSSALITNETNYPARPIIEIDDPETVRFAINDYVITIGDTDADTLIIDCELEDCYSYDLDGNVVNENGSVSIECSNPRELSDFPYIVPGENKFNTLGGTDKSKGAEEITSAIRIRPNWYRI